MDRFDELVDFKNDHGDYVPNRTQEKNTPDQVASTSELTNCRSMVHQWFFEVKGRPRTDLVDPSRADGFFSCANRAS